ncbi:MAG: DNA-directed RNA polymerase subunit omega [Deltaproteobacteria bacterium]|nr:MAG: DNA-directed RNA polymerase subunit omega [Deltaproteobacteria bacterium]
MARITVEDCLRQVKSRFGLAVVAAKRAKMLLQGAPPFVKCDNKAIVTALREIAASKVLPISKEEKAQLEEAKVKMLEAAEKEIGEQVYEPPELVYEPEEGQILEEGGDEGRD